MIYSISFRAGNKPIGHTSNRSGGGWRGARISGMRAQASPASSPRRGYRALPRRLPLATRSPRRNRLGRYTFRNRHQSVLGLRPATVVKRVTSLSSTHSVAVNRVSFHQRNAAKWVNCSQHSSTALCRVILVQYTRYATSTTSAAAAVQRSLLLLLLYIDKQQHQQ